MSFLKVIPFKDDANSLEVRTVTGQVIGFLKRYHDEWAFMPNSSGARLNPEVLNELCELIQKEILK